MLNLDTHILIDALHQRLRPAERQLLEGDAWSVSGIVLWELAALARAGRIHFGPDDPALRRLVRDMTVWPITLDIAGTLRRLDFRGDPADEIIAATSVVHDLPLVTRDMRILSSKVVPLALR